MPVSALFRWVSEFLVSLFIILIVSSAHAGCGPIQKPIIGIMLNSGDESGYSIYPWYALRKNYSQVVADLGAVPVLLSHDDVEAADYLSFLDGLVLTGGDFGTPDEAFTTGLKGPVDRKRFPRSAFEFELVQQAYARDLPVLGICAGMQNMNVAMGGTLYHNLKESLGTTIQHRNELRDKTQHSINVVPQSQLFQIIKVKKLEVNSNHNAGIKDVAPVLVVNARAPDGVIEGFEAPDKRFFMGVMWHPEFLLTEQERELWKAFVYQAAHYHQYNRCSY